MCIVAYCKSFVKAIVEASKIGSLVVPMNLLSIDNAVKMLILYAEIDES